MSKRQTQSVSPLTRKRDRSTEAQPVGLVCEMADSEGQNQPPRNVPNGTSANNEDQTVIHLLKTIVENQHKQAISVPPYTRNQGPGFYSPHCHCQLHLNDCQNQMQNPLSELHKADSPVINDEPSIKSLLITMLNNQTQPGSAYSWNQSHSYFRQPSLQPCQMHANHYQPQVQNQSFGYVPTSTAASTNKEEPSTRSLLMTILKNQTKMAAQLENLIQTQEEVIKKLDSQTLQTFSLPTRTTFKKIDSVKDCHEFEENLKNLEFAQNMFKHFESVCGGNSDLYGDNVAYALIDHIFTRRLFTLVTWTGLSRGTESKESFLKFERIFQFFFDLIRRVDSEYSIKSLKDFFQKIISNSKRRFEHKRSRISRVKLSSGMVVKRKKRSLPAKETNYVRRNSNVDGEQEIISDEITDNEDDFKDNISMYSNECNMNTIQRSRLIQLIKQHFPYTEPCDVDNALQWEIIAETLNALGPSQTIDQWIEDWETIKNCANEKLKAIKSKESDGIEIPEDLQLSEEDHRVIKICSFETDSDKMAKLVKMLDCRAVSPFQNESSESDGSDSENCEIKPIQEVRVDECLININETIPERNIALDQLEEQKKINVQLAELLAILKMPTQSSDAQILN